MNDELPFFLMFLGAAIIVMSLTIATLILWHQTTQYERNFMSYCTEHGDTFAKCEQLLEEQQ